MSISVVIMGNAVCGTVIPIMVFVTIINLKFCINFNIAVSSFLLLSVGPPYRCTMYIEYYLI